MAFSGFPFPYSSPTSFLHESIDRIASHLRCCASSCLSSFGAHSASYCQRGSFRSARVMPGVILEYRQDKSLRMQPEEKELGTSKHHHHQGGREISFIIIHAIYRIWLMVAHVFVRSRVLIASRPLNHQSYRTNALLQRRKSKTSPPVARSCNALQSAYTRVSGLKKVANQKRGSIRQRWTNNHFVPLAHLFVHFGFLISCSSSGSCLSPMALCARV